MKFFFKRWWLVILIGSLLSLVYLYGYHFMFFHQDDLDWFILANRPFWELMAAPIGDHVNYIWRVLLFSEWQLFGLNFPLYLAVSLAIHGLVTWLLYLLAYETSKRRDLATMAALLFAINTNWTEIILWISGQTISLTVLFVLLAMHLLWRKRGERASLLAAGFTSALALGLPVAALLTYGFTQKSLKPSKVGQAAVVSLVLTCLIYLTHSTDGTPLAWSLTWVYQVGLVWGLMIVHTVWGRLLIPFDRLESLRLGLSVFTTLAALFTWRAKLVLLWRDTWSRFLVIQIAVYYLVVAVGRAQYGVGIMRAERYAYLGLALALLLFVRVLRNIPIHRSAWVVVSLVMTLQIIGFGRRAADYVGRPQQLKSLFSELQSSDRSTIDGSRYLPHFVLNDERLRYSDILPLLNY